MSVRVSYSRTFAQLNREIIVSFQDVYSNGKQLLGVVFHNFPADSGLRRAPVGEPGRHVCVHETASGKGRSWTSNTSVSRTSNRSSSWGGNRNNYTAPQAEVDVAF